MIDQALMHSRKRKESQVAEAPGKTVIDVKRICHVKLQNEIIPSLVLLVIRSAIKDILDERFVARRM